MAKHPATGTDLDQFTDWLTDGPIDETEAETKRAAFFIESNASGIEELAAAWTAGEEVSWLGGPAPIDGEWPVNDDGEPLSHIGTLSLETVTQGIPEDERDSVSDCIALLPEGGYFSFFHDLRAYGDTESSPNSWRVVYCSDVDDRQPLSPDAVPEDTRPARLQIGELAQGLSILPPLDNSSTVTDQYAGGHDPGGAQFEEYNAKYEEYLSQWNTMRGRDGRHLIPCSALCAHSSISDVIAKKEYLPSAYPKDPDDEYVLLAQFESWTTLDGWFGDAAPLEYWIKRSDLHLGDYHKVWALIRTD